MFRYGGAPAQRMPRITAENPPKLLFYPAGKCSWLFSLSDGEIRVEIGP